MNRLLALTFPLVLALSGCGMETKEQEHINTVGRFQVVLQTPWGPVQGVVDVDFEQERINNIVSSFKFPPIPDGLMGAAGGLLTGNWMAVVGGVTTLVTGGLALMKTRQASQRAEEVDQATLAARLASVHADRMEKAETDDDVVAAKNIAVAEQKAAGVDALLQRVRGRA